MPGGKTTRIGSNLIGTALLCAGLVICFSPAVARAQPAATPKRILVLYWATTDYRSNMVFDQNFQEVLESSQEWIEYYPEYLDIDRFPGEAQSRLLQDYLRQKYADSKIDVVVAIGDPPLDFLLKRRDDLFPTAAIIFIANKPPTPEQIAAGPGLTGFVNRNPYRDTLDLALHLHPYTDQVFIVSGSLLNDKIFENTCRWELRDYETRATINYLTDLSPSELTLKMKSLPKRSLVLYVFQQVKDEQGRFLDDPRDVLAVLTTSASVPIYGMASWKVGRGIVGGYVRTMEMNAARTAGMALQIANGARAQDIPVENIPIVPMFDWRELQRWGISESRLPPGSIVRFRVPSFWHEYKWYAIAVSSVVIVQSLLITGLFINRTRRKRAEEALREAKESLTIAVEASQMGTWDLDLTKDFSGHRSLRHDQIFGYDSPQTEWGRKIARRHIVEEDREVFDTAFVRGMETGELEFEARIHWPNGSIHWMAVRGRFYFNKSGQPVRGAGVNFDITERKRAEAALRESEERFRHMADTAPVMIWISGVDKLYTYFNQQWLNFTGRTIGEELGNGWARGVHRDDYERCRETYTAAFLLRQPFSMEYRIRRADGEFRWVLESAAPRFSPGETFLGYIGSCIDITERKHAEEALEDLSGQLIRAREDECARIARELHDDLGQRMALISIELEQLGQNPPATNGSLGLQLQEILKLAADVAREIHRISYDLHPSKLTQLGLVAAVTSLCDDAIGSHQLKIEFLHEGVPANLPRDLSLCLYRISQECLNNVIKHSGAEDAKVELRGTENEVRLSVSDSGIGFDVESARSKGGLGLISMRERLRLVGGDFAIYSEPSQGTQINVLVPLNGQAGRQNGQPIETERTAKGFPPEATAEVGRTQ